MTFLATLLIGIVAGSRSMMAPAAVAWAARLGWIDLAPTWASFMGSFWAVLVFSILALGELVTDQLPTTPSRKVPVQFGARLVSGALCGAAICAPAGMLAGGLVAGVVGAIVGTLGGAKARSGIAAAFGRDLPAALLEDAVAVAGALLIVTSL